MLKTFIATLVLASTVLGLASPSNAGPKQQGANAPTGEAQYLERASKSWDGGGY